MRMSRLSLLAVLSLGLLCGCAILMDPAGHGVQPVYDARPQAKSRVVPGTADEVYQKVLAIASTYKWTVFREIPKDHLVVFDHIPGSVDTTQVGVFCTEDNGQVTVEISSPAMFSRELAAKVLFRNL